MKPTTPTIGMQACASSLLTHHGYDAATKTLAVTFKHGGTTYHYANVSPEQYAALTGADSIGKHFAAHIKGKPDRHPHTKLSKEQQ
ncbi:MAG TPA: KTSC domain-containing protein [Burkholderiales bacterium]|nr:KTSC domain-containing protein [Burkholderiales bacterium]